MVFDYGGLKHAVYAALPATLHNLPGIIFRTVLKAPLKINFFNQKGSLAPTGAAVRTVHNAYSL
jgi:hypothetical protein